MWTPKHVLTVAGLLIATQALPASFDCAKAATAVELAICSTAELSALDDELSTAYKAALAAATDPTGVVAAQRAWLRDKRNACSDENCLAARYKVRIGELRNDQRAGSTPSAQQPDSGAEQPASIRQEQPIQDWGVPAAKDAETEAAALDARKRAEEQAVGVQARLQIAQQAAEEKAVELQAAHRRELVLSVALGAVLTALVLVAWLIWARRRTAGAERSPEMTSGTRPKAGRLEQPRIAPAHDAADAEPAVPPRSTDVRSAMRDDAASHNGRLQCKYNPFLVLLFGVVLCLLPPFLLGHAVRQLFSIPANVGDAVFYSYLFFMTVILLAPALVFALLHAAGFHIIGQGRTRPRFGTLYSIQVLSLVISSWLLIGLLTSFAARPSVALALLLLVERPFVGVALFAGAGILVYYVALAGSSFGLLKGISPKAAFGAAIVPLVFYAAPALGGLFLLQPAVSNQYAASTAVSAPRERPVQAPSDGFIGAPFDEMHQLFCTDRLRRLTAPETNRLAELTQEQQRLTLAAMNQNDVAAANKLAIQAAKAVNTETCR